MAPELVAGLKMRDQAAFQRLVALHGPALYRIALRITGQAQDAEDVVQESLLIVMAKIDTLADPSALGAWLRRVVVNAALTRLRARDREPVAVPDTLDWAFTTDGRHSRQALGWPPCPEGEALRREARDVLEAAVVRLPQGARQVYVLAEIESLPYNEVAEALSISEGAVRVRLHRARLALREVLADYFTEQRQRKRTHKS